MHEVSLCEGIVSIVEEARKAHGFRRATLIRLRSARSAMSTSAPCASPSPRSQVAPRRKVRRS